MSEAFDRAMAMFAKETPDGWRAIHTGALSVMKREMTNAEKEIQGLRRKLKQYEPEVFDANQPAVGDGVS